MAKLLQTKLIDSHAHITAEIFENQEEQILLRAMQSGLKGIINIATNPKELEKGLALKQKWPFIFNAVATTPHDVEKEGETYFQQIAKAVREGKVVAVGETGLDYHYYPSTSAIQKKFLIAYLELALECQLPVIIHCREAFSDLFEILDRHYIQKPNKGGVLHCFTGNLKEAEQVIERGWYLSLSGIVTFKKSLELQEVAKKIPLSQMLIETDAPYLAPQSKRGKTNEPAYLIEVAQFIAHLREMDFEEFCSIMVNNTSKLFNISD